jgi:hypothetical protein
MLDAVVYNLLKEKLAETEYPVEIEGKKVKMLDWIATTLYEKAENAVKIQNANKDLTTQREEWEKQKKALDAEIVALKEKTAKIDKKGMNEEGEAKLNAAIQDAKDAKAKVDALILENQKEKTARLEADLRSEEATMRKDLIEKLGGKKIVDNSAKLALNTLITEGYASVVRKEDGSIERRFRLKDAAGNPLAATLEQVVEQFAKDNQNLVSGIPAKGTGTQTDRANSTGADDVNRVGFQSMVRTMRTQQ